MAVDWLIDCGWESNKRDGINERWRRRSFDKLYKDWVSFQDAIKLQTEFDDFWGG